MPPFSLLIFSLLSLSTANAAAVSLSPIAVPPTDPWQRLSSLAAASSARAHHLKHPSTTDTTAAAVPVFPRGYGGYSITLGVGTPPQALEFLMDTGSSLIWFPCTRRYACSSCDFPAANASTFMPKLSSSSRIVGCRNPKCRWVFPDVNCHGCRNNSAECNEFCPPYVIQYGSGSTSGLLLSETLTFPGKSVGNIIVGCSVFSSRQPAGIAGFGRGPESLPAQIRLKRFSYCLVSHRFDDKPASSDLLLDGPASAGISYTPFRKNPSPSNSVYQDYYYVTLRKITVGGVNVRAPYRFLVPDSDGRGGTIVDSGSTFTFMEGQVFELVARQLEKQIGRNYSRAGEVEKRSGLRPCFNVSGVSWLKLPQLKFHFKGGAKMELPLADYFSLLGDSVICMTIVTNDGAGAGVGMGPAIILGNYQQQNIYIEYDLQNQRLGFQNRVCK